jgi:hypothetical protein
MKKNIRANDTNLILRAFFIHCFVHIYQAITTSDISNIFTIQPMYSGHQDSNYLKKLKINMSNKLLIRFSKILL